MKILILGQDVTEGWARTFKRCFESYGNSTEILDDNNLFRSTFPLMQNRYAYRILWYPFAVFFQKALIKNILGSRPDLIFLFKGFLISSNTLRKLRRNGIIIFNYNPDNPFNTWHHGNSNSWIRKSIPLYDAYLIWSKTIVEKLKKFGAKRAEYLACGYDDSLHYPVEVSSEERKIFGSDIAFIGTHDKEREGWINNILDFDLKIWGNSWEKTNANIQNKWQKKAVVGEEFSKVCASSKIVINFLRRQNLDAHNMRTFEVPACRGFLLSTRSKEQLDFFEEGREAAYFSTPEELREKIRYYLEHDNEREEIRNAGYERLKNSPYSYRDRAKEVLDIYEEIKKETPSI